MNSRRQKSLTAFFSDPVRSDIAWTDIESLFIGYGGEASEGRGSRVWVELNSVFATFHRPHPHPSTDKGAVKSVRRFLENAGVKP